MNLICSCMHLASAIFTFVLFIINVFLHPTNISLPPELIRLDNFEEIIQDVLRVQQQFESQNDFVQSINNSKIESYEMQFQVQHEDDIKKCKIDIEKLKTFVSSKTDALNKIVIGRQHQNNEINLIGPAIGTKGLTKSRRILDVEFGGHFKPKNCKIPIQNVALIVPYRDRQDQLDTFTQYIHQFLQNQNTQYTIYVIEQGDLKPFNRAKLFNVGVLEIIKRNPKIYCFIFHDVDLLPIDQRNLYACSSWPRHMSEAVDTLRFNLLYPQLFGGAVAISKQQFFYVNGFANRFFGWGGEDDDMYQRIKRANLKIIRWPNEWCRYYMIHHKKAQPNPHRFALLNNYDDNATNVYNANYDSLNATTYQIINVIEEPLFTRIKVNLGFVNLP